jgi:hypothetical protein
MESSFLQYSVYSCNNVFNTAKELHKQGENNMTKVSTQALLMRDEYMTAIDH